MRIFLAMIMFCVTVSALAAPPHFDDPALRARYQHLTERLRCVVCLNENIAQSQAPLAGDMRQLVAERIRAGDSDEQIKKIFVDRYGEFVLYKPRFKPATYILWFAPGVLLLLGLIIGGVLLYRSRRIAEPDHNVDYERVDKILNESDNEDQNS